MPPTTLPPAPRWAAPGRDDLFLRDRARAWHAERHWVRYIQRHLCRLTVTGLSPNTDSVAGGTTVTITGNNFISGATVNFGGTAATNVTVSSATQITAVDPAETAGTVDVHSDDGWRYFGDQPTGRPVRLHCPASRLKIDQQPPPAPPPVSISPDHAPVIVEVDDQNGNRSPQMFSTVTLSLNAGSFAGGAPTAAVRAASRRSTTSPIDTVGTYTLTASDGALASAQAASTSQITPAHPRPLGDHAAARLTAPEGATISPVIVAVEDRSVI